LCSFQGPRVPPQLLLASLPPAATPLQQTRPVQHSYNQAVHMLAVLTPCPAHFLQQPRPHCDKRTDLIVCFTDALCIVILRSNPTNPLLTPWEQMTNHCSNPTARNTQLCFDICFTDTLGTNHIIAAATPLQRVGEPHPLWAVQHALLDERVHRHHEVRPQEGECV